MGQHSPNHQWDMRKHSLFLLNPMRARWTSINLRVLHGRLLLHKQAKEARVWVKVKEKAHRPRLQEPRGVPMPSHFKLSRLISRLYRVCFCYLAYRQRYCYSSASHSFVAASSVDVLGLELEPLEELLHVSSPLGTRVRIYHIC